MILTIKLTPTTEARLKARAAREGRPEEEIASEELERLIGGGLEEAETDDTSDHALLPKTPAEALAYWQREGALGLWKDRGDSLTLARELRRQAETRSRG